MQVSAPVLRDGAARRARTMGRVSDFFIFLARFGHLRLVY